MTLDWKTKTYPLSLLKRAAMEYSKPMSAKEWLIQIGVLPPGVKYRKGDKQARGYDPTAIRGEHLVQLANDFDGMGVALPITFIQNIEWEDNYREMRDEVYTLGARPTAVGGG